MMKLFFANCWIRLEEYAADYPRSNVFWFLEAMKVKWERG